MIQTFGEFIKESFNDGYGLTMTILDKSGNKSRENMTFDRIEDARMFMINWLTKHPE